MNIEMLFGRSPRVIARAGAQRKYEQLFEKLRDLPYGEWISVPAESVGGKTLKGKAQLLTGTAHRAGIRAHCVGEDGRIFIRRRAEAEQPRPRYLPAPAPLVILRRA